MSTQTLSRKAEFRAKFLQATVLENKYIPQKPTAKQAKFLLETGREVLFGGAVAGGKSSAILMAALQFVSLPNYAAIIFRRTFQDLALPGALMDRAHSWLQGTDARWHGQDKKWVFPSGSTLSFGYLDSANDRYRYQSSEFGFIGFDELTQFKRVDYEYLFSRLRRNIGNNIPLRTRAATNPGGIGHSWVKKRFGIGRFASLKSDNARVFIPSKLEDNKHVDAVEYAESLSNLDAFTRKQLRSGDWTDFSGTLFTPSAWPRYTDIGDAYSCPMVDGPREIHRKVDCTNIIALDWALNKPKKYAPGEIPEWANEENMDSDYTAFVVAALTKTGLLLILDVVNERIKPQEKSPRLAALCGNWGPMIVVSDDDMIAETMQLDVRRHRIPEIRTLKIGNKNKRIRAEGAILRGERGKIFLPIQDEVWLDEYSDQLAAFTGVNDEYDDMVDATGILGRVADELKEDEVDCFPVSMGDQPEIFGRNGTWY